MIDREHIYRVYPVTLANDWKEWVGMSRITIEFKWMKDERDDGVLGLIE